MYYKCLLLSCLGLCFLAYPLYAQKKLVLGSALKFAKATEKLDSLAREPMIVEHPEGALFVAGYGASVPTLWMSKDKGATWQSVNLGSEAEGAIGNSDVDLAMAPDGTLYMAVMTFDRTKYWGLGISIGVSKDQGKQWKWHRISETKYDDRPWIEIAPDGKVHVIWNDGQGVCYASSVDGGQSWQEQKRIYEKGGGSSHLAVGPKGEIAVRITPTSASAHKYDEGLDYIAVSVDGGDTWQTHTPPGKQTWEAGFSLNRWVDPLAWDAKGGLYHVWSEDSRLMLGYSKNQGKNWEEWIIAESDKELFFPYLIAREEGELAATWFSKTKQEDDLEAHVGYINLKDAIPSIRMTPALELECFRRNKYDTGGEYFPIIFLKDGSLAIVNTIQNDKDNRFGFKWQPVSKK